MSDGVVLVKQDTDGDRAIDNELVLNDVGAMVYRQKVAVANFPAGFEISNDVGNPIPVSGTVTTAPDTATTATVTSVAASTTSQTLLASNAARKMACIYNESTDVMYLKLGSSATTLSYTLQLAAGDYFEIPVRYTGAITAVWSSATGKALVTEL